MKFGGFQDIFIIKPEKNHITLLPPSYPHSAPRRDHGRFTSRSDEWFRRSEVDYNVNFLVWNLYLNSRLTQFVMVSFSLKKTPVSYLEYKTAKPNALQTENHTFTRQNRPLKRTSRPLSRDGELSAIYFMQKSRETTFDQSWPTFPSSSCLVLRHTKITTFPFSFFFFFF